MSGGGFQREPGRAEQDAFDHRARIPYRAPATFAPRTSPRVSTDQISLAPSRTAGVVSFLSPACRPMVAGYLAHLGETALRSGPDHAHPVLNDGVTPCAPFHAR